MGLKTVPVLFARGSTCAVLTGESRPRACVLSKWKLELAMQLHARLVAPPDAACDTRNNKLIVSHGTLLRFPPLDLI